MLIATSLCSVKAHPHSLTARSHPWNSLVRALVGVSIKPHDRLVPACWVVARKGWPHCRSISPRWASRTRGSVTSRAASNIAEADSVAAATGAGLPRALLRLRALQGREAEASAAIASAIEQAAGGSLGAAIWRTGPPLSCITASPATRRRWRPPANPHRTPSAVGIRMGASRARRGGRACGRHGARTAMRWTGSWRRRNPVVPMTLVVSRPVVGRC